MSSTSPFLAMREQLLAAYAMYIPSQRRHIVAVRICWAILLAAHLAILSLRVWRAVRGHDKFWMLRVVRRARGAYLVPHAIVGWCIPATIFCALQITCLSIQLVSFEPPYRYAELVPLMNYIIPIFLFTALWLSAGALAVSVLLTFEGSSYTPHRLLTWTCRLPTPFVFHTILYGFLFAFVATIAAVDAVQYTTDRRFFGMVSEALTVIDGLIDGSVPMSAITQLTTVGTTLTDLGQEALDRNCTSLIAFLSFGTVGCAAYIPFALALVWQLRQLTSRSCGRTTLSVASQQRSSIKAAFESRYILVAVHALLFLLWAGTQLIVGFYVLFALHKGSPIHIALLAQMLGMLVCCALFTCVLILHCFFQVAAGPSASPTAVASTYRKTAVPDFHIDLAAASKDDLEEGAPLPTPLSEKPPSMQSIDSRGRKRAAMASLLASTAILETQLDDGPTFTGANLPKERNIGKSLIFIKSLNVEARLDPATAGIYDYTLTGAPNRIRLVNKPTVIFAIKVPQLTSAQLNGISVDSIKLEADSVVVIIMKSAVGKTKYQINDASTGGIFQCETEYATNVTFVHMLGPKLFYLRNEFTGKINFGSGEDAIACAQDPVNYHDMLLGKDSPQVATKTLQTSTETRWNVAPGGRMGGVLGEDAIELSQGATSCTSRCQAQNRLKDSVAVPSNSIIPTPLRKLEVR